jgi:hypothetical protein
MSLLADVIRLPEYRNSCEFPDKARRTDMKLQALAVSALLLIITATTIACNSLGGGQGSTNAPSSDFIFAGCYAPGATQGNSGCGLASTLGDPNSDAAFQAEVGNQSYFWSGIPANVNYWNDCQSPNSVSLPTGDILYGVSLFQELATAYGGDAGPISGVLAHEWAHQIQFDNGWFSSDEPTAAPTELEADAFSGFYMALGPDNFPWTSVDNYFSALASLGDYNFTDPSHHGTPQQRLAAGQLGFQTAVQAYESGEQLAYSDLHQIFSSAIGGFDARKIEAGKSSSPEAAHFLQHLDQAQIFAILDGTSHGREERIPSVNRSLFPRK